MSYNKMKYKVIVFIRIPSKITTYNGFQANVSTTIDYKIQTVVTTHIRGQGLKSLAVNYKSTV